MIFDRPLNSAERLTTDLTSAVPVSQFTPTQAYFRANATGRMPSTSYAHANLNGVRRYSDGTCDLIRLDVAGPDWIDLGGRGAPDVAAGRC